MWFQARAGRSGRNASTRKKHSRTCRQKIGGGCRGERREKNSTNQARAGRTKEKATQKALTGWEAVFGANSLVGRGHAKKRTVGPLRVRGLVEHPTPGWASVSPTAAGGHHVEGGGSSFSEEERMGKSSRRRRSPSIRRGAPPPDAKVVTKKRPHSLREGEVATLVAFHLKSQKLGKKSSRPSS